MVRLIADVEDREMANGMRDTSGTPLSEDEIRVVLSEIRKYMQMSQNLFLMMGNI